MTCSTCGRDNPAHLTFCQECGQRLQPRIAPPTPPIGLDPFTAPVPPPGNPRTQLLNATAQATDFKAGVFMPPAGAVPAPAASSGERRCKICDTVNGPNLRYCTSCGSTLEPAPAPVAAPAAVPAPSPIAPVAPVPVAPAPPPDVAPIRVVPLGGDSAKTIQDARTCSRCRGVVDPGAQFCKFCGNNLHVEPARPAVPVAAPTPEPPRADALLPHERLDLPSSNGSLSPKPAPIGAGPKPAANPIGGGSVVPGGSSSGKMPTGAAALAALPRPASSPPLAGPSATPQVTGPSPAKPATAAGPPRGRLVVIAKSGADGPSYPFGDLFDVGRTEGNVVVPEDPYLSPRHVRILWNNGKLILRDLGSTNGVYLRLAASRDTSVRREGNEVTVPLIDQDMLLVGQQVLRFDVLKEGEGGLGPAAEHGTLLFGSPAAPRYARLCQRTVEGITRDVYYIRKTETVLGRESGDVVFTEDPFLSRRHAALRVTSRDAGAPPKFTLVDLGSSNGTFLKMRSDVDLTPGDHFRVGQQLFRVDFDGAQT